jgi:hypothetical protein
MEYDVPEVAPVFVAVTTLVSLLDAANACPEPSCPIA